MPKRDVTFFFDSCQRNNIKPWKCGIQKQTNKNKLEAFNIPSTLHSHIRSTKFSTGTCSMISSMAACKKIIQILSRWYTTLTMVSWTDFLPSELFWHQILNCYSYTGISTVRHRVQMTWKSRSLKKFGYTQDNTLLFRPIVAHFLSTCDCFGFYTCIHRSLGVKFCT